MRPLLLLAGACLLQGDVRWTTYDGVSIPVPPAGHPRLYLRARDIPGLQRRTTHPILKPVWEKLQAAAKNNPALAVEVDAVRYLLSKDADLGRRTAATALKLLQDTTFDKTRQDITRPIGRLLTTGAMVYDWCYPVLTPDQKTAYLERFLHLARSLESGYPPPKSHAVTGHYSEWMLMRDLLSAGVSAYDESPEMYQIAANRFFGLFVPVRNWWYRGNAFHQGSAYAETRVSSEMYPLWIFSRMDAGPVYDPALQYVPYQWIYMRRPDGQLLRSGDGQSRAPKLRSLLNASYYKDPYVLADYLRDPDIEPSSLIFAFLWRDPDLKPRPVSELPLSRYMGTPYGWMVARTGWDSQSVIAEMKVNIFNFNNHQHLDAGAFQIYCQGPLAIDSGLYQGSDGGYGSTHDVNYNKRTIAHNSLLVHDPEERFARGNRDMRNDGGQKFPNGWREPRSLEDMLANYRTAQVLGHGFGPDPRQPAYTYLKGDLTPAYSGKVREVQRSFVFLNLAGQPARAALIVFDRVVAADPRFKKYWLLHSMEEPRIEGAVVTLAPAQRGWRGKLVNQVLLPGGARITPVGGAGKEFWVFGENFPNRPERGSAADYEIGEWRVEVSPGAAAASDLFLNVMQAMDRDASPRPVRLIEERDLTGLILADTTVLFQRDGRRAKRPVTFQSRGNRFLVTDLAEGDWRVLRDGAATGPAVRVTGDEGALWFEGQPGSYTLQR
jgi:heparin/heparan-sulfate lyase